ncbi:hypothetical protein O181_077946 [Austropuccinia psidii MF-1]|uniref:Retroviral polymerase SH3-like domain-containing protein n=1 Tax=Austropuccinia psidii MF-1 TaxID=1389203 RepID=A0A9Q3FDB7_9BASI|nr:hypothetical protein [Austropuccinia psidii MF-1]
MILTNIIPTPSRNNYSPHYLWLKVPPKIRKIRTSGCKVVFATPKQKPTWKLGPVGETGILLGFENEAYCILKISDKKVYSSRHVVFFEKEFASLSDNEKSDLSSSYPSWDDWRPRHPTLINSEIREERILPYPRRPVALNTQNDPLSYNQAVNSPYSNLWVKAI